MKAYLTFCALLIVFFEAPLISKGSDATDTQTRLAFFRSLDFYNVNHLSDVEIYAGLIYIYQKELQKTQPDVPQINLEALRIKAQNGGQITLADLGLDINGDLHLPWNYFSASTVASIVIAHDYIAGKSGSSGYYAFDKLDLKDFLPESAKKDIFPTPVGDKKVATIPLVPPTEATGPKYEVEKATYHLNRSISDIVSGSTIPDQAAVFSYSKNLDSGHDQFGAQGTLSADFPLYISDQNPPAGTSPFLRQIDFTPNITLEKITGQTSATNDVDTLAPSLTVQDLEPLPSPDSNPDLILGFNQSLALSLATDFEFEQKVIGVQYDFNPICPAASFGGMTALFPHSPILVGTLLDIHAESGTVLDVGKSTTLKKSDVYLRAGPKVGLTFQGANTTRSQIFGGEFGFALSDIILSASYTYFPEAIGNDGDVYLFDTSLQYAINGSKNLSLRAEFQEGKTDLLLQRRDQFTTGLALKF